MDYLNSFQNWLYKTNLYQQFLQNMPPPINNIYFDTFFILIAVIYLVYRIVDRIRVVRYHRKIRERQAKEQRERKNAERELYERESEVRNKEEKIGRFLDVVEFYFWNRGGGAQQGETRQRKGFFSRIGHKELFLTEKTGMELEPIETMSDIGHSDYDARMKDYEESRMQEARFQESRRKAREQLDESMTILNEQLQVDQDLKVVESSDLGVQRDRRYEKRKAKALREIQKEQRKAERLAKKVQRKAEKEDGMAKQV